MAQSPPSMASPMGSEMGVPRQDLERLRTLYGGHNGFQGRAVSRILEIDLDSLSHSRPNLRSEKTVLYEFGRDPSADRFKIVASPRPPASNEAETTLLMIDSGTNRARAWGGTVPESMNMRFQIRNITSDLGRPLVPPVLYYLNQQQYIENLLQNVRVWDSERNGVPIRRFTAHQPGMGGVLLGLERDSGHIVEFQTISLSERGYRVRVTYLQMNSGSPDHSFFGTGQPDWALASSVPEQWGLADEPDWVALRLLARTLSPGQQPPSSPGHWTLRREEEPDISVDSPSATEAKPSQRLSREQMQALVLVERGVARGSGFAVHINDMPFVITNLHVLGDGSNLRLRTMSGNHLRVAAAFAARGHDVALLRVEEIPASFTFASNVFDIVEIGDEVVVAGNRQGAGVATQVIGRVVGLGPDRVEVDAPFQQGNSGSPIVHQKSGKVIGVAAYMQEVAVRSGDGSRDRRPDLETTTRWFGFRYDSISEWERIDWTEWKRQYDAIAGYRENSEALLALLRGDHDGYSRNNRLNPIISRLERDLRAGTSEDHLTRRYRQFFSELVNFSRADAQSLEGGFYDFFQNGMYFDSSIRLQKELRQNLLEFFEHTEREIRNHALRRP